MGEGATWPAITSRVSHFVRKMLSLASIANCSLRPDFDASLFADLPMNPAPVRRYAVIGG